MADLVARLEVRVYGAAATTPPNFERGTLARALADAVRLLEDASRVEVLTPEGEPLIFEGTGWPPRAHVVGPVLGRCRHGFDLDREFCPEGCRV